MEHLVYRNSYGSNLEDVVGYYVVKATAEGKRATEIVIPAERDGLPVDGILEYALSYRGKLERLVISDNVKWIGHMAFSECKNLRSVKLSENLVTLGAEAFSFCKSLREIYVPSGVSEIKKGTFFGCDALELAVLGDGVTQIAKDAFWCCKGLKTVSLPASVTHIEKGAFYDCVSLSDVYFGGSEDDWQRINMEKDNEKLTGAKIHYSSKYRAADFDESYNTKNV